MERNEILTRSRQENQGQDIANLEVFKSAVQTAWTVTICLASVICVADAFVFSRACYELLFTICTSSAVVFVCKYRVLRKKHELLLALCYCAGALSFLIAWGAQILNR